MTPLGIAIVKWEMTDSQDSKSLGSTMKIPKIREDNGNPASTMKIRGVQ
jgi:hypothetical protein